MANNSLRPYLCKLGPFNHIRLIEIFPVRRNHFHFSLRISNDGVSSLVFSHSHSGEWGELNRADLFGAHMKMRMSKGFEQKIIVYVR
jgi:hypothetical protein